MLLGAVGIFFYVGAEVGTGGLILNYLKTTQLMESAVAGKYVAIYWGGAMVGRFFGWINRVLHGCRCCLCRSSLKKRGTQGTAEAALGA